MQRGEKDRGDGTRREGRERKETKGKGGRGKRGVGFCPLSKIPVGADVNHNIEII